MPQQTITIVANSLEQAKELLKTRVPEGFQIISEEIISDDIPKVMNISGDSSELALEKLKTRLPVDAELLEWKEITPAERKLISVDAEDEQSAQTQALFNIIGKRPTIKRVSIISKGSKGFLGIGKKINQYQFEIFHESNIKATYRTKAKISATIVKL